MEPTQNKNILIVDDNTELCEVIKYYFDNKGFQTFFASSVAEACLSAEAHRPELVISDFNLPDGDGLVLLEKINKKYRGQSQPVVALMSGFTLGLAEVACELGAEFVFSKPFDFDDFLSQIQNVLSFPEERRAFKNLGTRYENLSTLAINLSQLSFFGHSDQFSMGKTGFFTSVQNKTFPEEDSVVNFEISFQDITFLGIGCVRWVRLHQSIDRHPPGFGVRILSLDESCREQVLEHLRINPPNTFIPRF